MLKHVSEYAFTHILVRATTKACIASMAIDWDYIMPAIEWHLHIEVQTIATLGHAAGLDAAECH